MFKRTSTHIHKHTGAIYCTVLMNGMCGWLGYPVSWQPHSTGSRSRKQAHTHTHTARAAHLDPLGHDDLARGQLGVHGGDLDALQAAPGAPTGLEPVIAVAAVTQGIP